MTFGKKFGPGEGFSVRRGGELASDEDDVEGHMTGAPVKRAEDESGRNDMDEKRQDEDTEGHVARPRVRASDDDTEGNIARPTVRASDDDTEGHLGGGGKKLLSRESDDDTEGHLGGGGKKLQSRESGEDDTEGHRMLAQSGGPLRKASDDEDDTEGHRMYQQGGPLKK